MPAELHERYSDPVFSLGLLDRCLLSVWRRDTSTHSTFQVARAVQELRTLQPDIKLALLSLVEPDCVVPASEDVARAWCDLLKRQEGTIVGTAVVYNREGFWSASMRGQVMAINTESKAGIPHFVTPSLPAACAWLVELLASAPSAAAVQQAVERLRPAPQAERALG